MVRTSLDCTFCAGGYQRRVGRRKSCGRRIVNGKKSALATSHEYDAVAAHCELCLDLVSLCCRRLLAEP